MDEIFQIMMIAVAIGISLFVQQKTKKDKTPPTASPQEVLNEVFPEIEEYQEKEMSQSIKKTNTSNRKKTQLQFKPDIKRQTSPAIPSAAPKQRNRIRLSTQEEAKRAFIYSEIFNRKY